MRADNGGSAASLPFLSLIEELDVPLDADLLDLALTHRSYAYEHGQIPTNERLEFLGDSVLGVIVTEYLYRSYPDHAEGQLAKLRASVVSAVSLAMVARKLNIGPMIKLGKGEISTGGSDKSSILADTTEALIGAVFLSGGREAAERLVHHIFDPLAQVCGNFLVNRQLTGVDDPHIHARLDRVVEEHRVHRLAHRLVAAERERQV